MRNRIRPGRSVAPYESPWPASKRPATFPGVPVGGSRRRSDRRLARPERSPRRRPLSTAPARPLLWRVRRSAAIEGRRAALERRPGEGSDLTTRPTLIGVSALDPELIAAARREIARSHNLPVERARRCERSRVARRCESDGEGIRCRRPDRGDTRHAGTLRLALIHQSVAQRAGRSARMSGVDFNRLLREATGRTPFDQAEPASQSSAGSVSASASRRCRLATIRHWRSARRSEALRSSFVGRSVSTTWSATSEMAGALDLVPRLAQPGSVTEANALRDRVREGGRAASSRAVGGRRGQGRRRRGGSSESALWSVARLSACSDREAAKCTRRCQA